MENRKLRGRIRECFDTQASFAIALGMSPATLSQKLNGRTDFDRQEIQDACRLLEIPLDKAYLYFFS